jgi:hypothetical protein
MPTLEDHVGEFNLDITIYFFSEGLEESITGSLIIIVTDF